MNNVDKFSIAENITNINAARKLVHFYKTISLKFIKDHWDIVYLPNADRFKGEAFASRYSNFSTSHCSLCRSIRITSPCWFSFCSYCIHAIALIDPPRPVSKSLNFCLLDDTYYKISRADTPEELFDAFRNRAKYIQGLIDKYNSITIANEPSESDL